MSSLLTATARLFAPRFADAEPMRRQLRAAEGWDRFLGPIEPPFDLNGWDGSLCIVNPQPAVRVERMVVSRLDAERSVSLLPADWVVPAELHTLPAFFAWEAEHAEATAELERLRAGLTGYAVLLEAAGKTSTIAESLSQLQERRSRIVGDVRRESEVPDAVPTTFGAMVRAERTKGTTATTQAEAELTSLEPRRIEQETLRSEILTRLTHLQERLTIRRAGRWWKAAFWKAGRGLPKQVMQAQAELAGVEQAIRARLDREQATRQSLRETLASIEATISEAATYEIVSREWAVAQEREPLEEQAKLVREEFLTGAAQLAAVNLPVPDHATVDAVRNAQLLAADRVIDCERRLATLEANRPIDHRGRLSRFNNLDPETTIINGDTIPPHAWPMTGNVIVFVSQLPATFTDRPIWELTGECLRYRPGHDFATTSREPLTDRPEVSLGFGVDAAGEPVLTDVTFPIGFEGPARWVEAELGRAHVPGAVVRWVSEAAVTDEPILHV